MSDKRRANPADVRELANDLERCITCHPDACRANPDLQAEIAKVRDKVWKRYEQISETGKGFTKDGDLIP